MALAMDEQILARRAASKACILESATSLPLGIYILHILGESGIIQFNSVISAFNSFEGEAWRIIRGGMPLSLGPGWVD